MTAFTGGADDGARDGARARFGAVSTTTPPRAPRSGEPQGVDPGTRMFASRTVTEHVVRGVLGLALAVAAVVLAGDHPWAMIGLVGTVVLWRGCPTCWAMGLAATLAGRRTEGDRAAGCVDGTCR